MRNATAHNALYAVAEAHAGYFTAAQALRAGLSETTLRHHARPEGRFERRGRGLYRLRHFPPTPTEHIVAAWVAVGRPDVAVSHDSALELYGLTDAEPETIHLLGPRKAHGVRAPAGVTLHLTARSFDGELWRQYGVPTTSPERSLVDALHLGAQPDQITTAAGRALARSLLTPDLLRAAARNRPRRVREHIDLAVAAP